MKSKDLVRLRRILKYADEGVSFVQGKTRDSLEEDVLLTRALCYSAVMVGQISSKVSGECQMANPQIPWQDAMMLRDYLPNYSMLDHDRLWKDATEMFPGLVAELEKLIPPHQPVEE